jgi:CRISPR system Cascade subunit CasB
MEQKQQPLPIGVVMKWWGELEEHRGDRAELRRCRSPAEVVFVPAFYRLKAMMPESMNTMHLAAVAGILSHVEAHLDGTARTAELFAHPKERGSTPRVSELRFRRLLRVPDYSYDELYPMMTRLLRQIDRKAHLPSLIPAIYWWNSLTKRRWAESYYEHLARTEK